MGTRRRYVPWVLACLAAELTGMSGAAAAARFGHDLFGDGSAPIRWLLLALAVVGCLVEGLALGLLQTHALSLRHIDLSRDQMLRVAVEGTVVAWAVAVFPTLLAGHVHGGPPIGLLVSLAVGLGLFAGTLLEVKNSTLARGVVTDHPWRWVTANALVWPTATILLFFGASALDTGRPLIVVAGLALTIGVLAAAVLGVRSGAWMGTVNGQPIANKVSLAMVERHRFGMDRRVVGLGVTGRRTGRIRQFPVQYVEHGDALIVVPVHPGQKSWWRNLTGEDTSIAVLDHDGWRRALAHVMVPGDNGHSAAESAYRLRWPRVPLDAGQPLVVLARDPGGIPSATGQLESVG